MPRSIEQVAFCVGIADRSAKSGCLRTQDEFNLNTICGSFDG